MDLSAIRVRYAKAFFSLANEKKMMEILKTDIEKIFNVCNHSSDFVLLLESPIVPTSKKVELISTIFKGEVNDLTLNFLILITNNKREAYIPGICRNFLALVRKDRNIKSAILITASEINLKSLEKIKGLIEKELKATVELDCKIEPELIGGLILRIDDIQYDASITTQLKKIKKNLLESELK